MKKIVYIIFLLLIVFNLSSCTSNQIGQDFDSENELVYEDIVDEIIRFHVIANSDSEEDQNLKLKVRDEIIEFVSSGLSESTSLEESRQFIINNKSQIEAIANSVISKNGYSYNISSALSRENFPDKIYGDVVFPQGEYEAYRIIIGEGKGENWWCVMFPPLCFVDGTKEAVDSTEVIDKLENGSLNEDVDDRKIEFKFKLLEVFDKNK